MAQVSYSQGVPTITPDVRAPDDTQRIQANPSAFGAEIAQGGQQLGAGLLKAGQFYGQVAADDASNHLQEQATKLLYGDPDKTTIGPDGKPQPDLGYLGLRGRAAMDARPAVEKQIQELTQTLKSNLSTPESQLQFDNFSRRYRSIISEKVGSHADGQSMNWYNDVSQSRVKVNLDSIANAPDDIQSVQHAYGDIIGAKIQEAQRLGAQPGDDVWNQKLAEGNAAAVKTWVQATAVTNPTKAMEILDAHRQEAGTEYEVLANQLRPRIIRDKAVSDADQIFNQGTAPSPTAGSAQVHAAILGQESGNRSNIHQSIDGAQGPGQVMPATFAAYAKPGERIDNPDDNRAVSRRIVDDYYQRYHGDAQRVAVAYFSGPGNVAPEGSPTPYKVNRADGNGKTVSSYVDDVSRRISGSALPAANPQTTETAGTGKMTPWEIEHGFGTTPPPGGEQPPTGTTQQAPVEAGMPDKSTAIRRAIELAGPDAQQQRANVAEVNRRYSEFNAGTATERAEVMGQIPDLMKAAQFGVQGIQFPEAKVRALLPPQKAQALIDEFHVATAVGDVMRGVEWASPTEVGQMQADLSSGQGVLSDMMKVHAKGPTSGPGAVGANPDDDQAMYFRLRQGAANRLAAEVDRRQQILLGPQADPAAYAAANPTVRNYVTNLDPKQPRTFEQYATAILGLQDHLGVPIDKQHVLTRAQAQDATSKIMAPNADVKAEMDGLQKQFGSAWDHVFRDMVTLGQLPAGYQAVSVLDSNNSSILSRVLRNDPSEKQKPWEDRLRVGVQDVAKDIRTSISGSTDIANLKQSLRMQGCSEPMIDGVQNSVEMLAYGRKLYANDADAANSAIKAFTDQYEFMPNGGARVPVAARDVVSGNMAAALDGLKKETVTVPGGFGQLGQATADDYLRQIQAQPTWVNTPKGDGVMLLDWQARAVRDAAGKPIIVPFSAPASPAPVVPGKDNEFMRGGSPVPGL